MTYKLKDFSTVNKIYRNLSVPILYEHSLKWDNVKISSSGALTILTGDKKGRSPEGKRIVTVPNCTENLWWSDETNEAPNNNNPCNNLQDENDKIKCLFCSQRQNQNLPVCQDFNNNNPCKDLEDENEKNKCLCSQRQNQNLPVCQDFNNPCNVFEDENEKNKCLCRNPQNQNPEAQQRYKCQELSTFGGSGGVKFGPIQIIKTLQISGGDVVDAIYINGKRFGGGGGSRSDMLTLTLDDGEYINEGNVSEIDYLYNTIIGSLEFKTSNGKSIKRGNDNNNYVFRLTNRKVTEIGGSAGVYLDSITF